MLLLVCTLPLLAHDTPLHMLCQWGLATQPLSGPPLNCHPCQFPNHPPINREQLVWVAPALRLLAELALRTDGGLAGIDALLGCPLALPAPGWYLLQGGGGVGGWEALPQSSKAGVLLALFHGIGWCREVLNMFAQGVSHARCGVCVCVRGGGASPGSACRRGRRGSLGSGGWHMFRAWMA